jgi:hypothetical protein
VSILVDSRLGSGNSRNLRLNPPLVCYPPLNLCLTCGGQFTLTKHSRGKVPSWDCQTGIKFHEPLSTLCQLDSGDVAFTGNGPDGPITVGVEVKSIFDVIGSLISGRLQATQLKELSAAYDVRWLLYYGNYRCNPKNGALQIHRRRKNTQGRKYGAAIWDDYTVGNRTVMFSYADGFLASPSFTLLGSLGVRAHRVLDMAEAAAWIGRILYPCWQKPWSAHKSMRVFDRSREVAPANVFGGPDGRDSGQDDGKGAIRGGGKSGSGDTDDVIYHRACTAKEWPGLGYERAVAAAEQIGSIRTMANATIDEWAAVTVTSAKGRVAKVGKVVAKAIVEAVTR